MMSVYRCSYEYGKKWNFKSLKGKIPKTLGQNQSQNPNGQLVSVVSGKYI